MNPLLKIAVVVLSLMVGSAALATTTNPTGPINSSYFSTYYCSCDSTVSECMPNGFSLGEAFLAVGVVIVTAAVTKIYYLLVSHEDGIAVYNGNSPSGGAVSIRYPDDSGVSFNELLAKQGRDLCHTVEVSMVTSVP